MSQLFDTRSLLRDMILAGMEETFLRLEAEVTVLLGAGFEIEELTVLTLADEELQALIDAMCESMCVMPKCVLADE
jgi:hypothetical protein